MAGGQYFDSIATGLRDNVRRQALFDGESQRYALILVPVWNTADSTAGTVHISGFAQMKVREVDISDTRTVGTFVPYATAPWGPYAAPAVPDFGAALVSIVS